MTTITEFDVMCCNCCGQHEFVNLEEHDPREDIKCECGGELE